MKIHLCAYGCGQLGIYKFKNGKYCCSTNIAKCKHFRDINSSKLKGLIRSKKTRKIISEAGKGRIPWNKGKIGVQIAWNKGLTKETDKRVLKYSETQTGKELSVAHKKKISKTKTGVTGSKHTKETKKKLEKLNKGSKNPMFLTINRINKKHLLFSKIEEMRYNPDKPGEKEIQVHCKNHKCNNSKEKNGWFTPSRCQLYERIRQIESIDGSGGCYLYCCQECKNNCVLYNLKSDPFKNTNLPYTQDEYNTWRAEVDRRANGILCEICGEEIATDAHHIRPVKLEPIFALDPDFGIMLCEKCHYQKGHKKGTECSTGNLAKKYVKIKRCLTNEN